MKKFVKIFLSFLIMVVGFTSVSNSINAVSYPTNLNNVKKGTVLKYNGYDSMYYKTSGNYKVFCTTFHTFNVGTKCSLSASQWSLPVQAGVAAIIKKYNSNQTQKNYYYSELAVNEFLYYYSGKNSVNRISKSRDVRNTSGVKDFYNAAVKAYNDAKSTYKIKLSTNKLTFKLSGDYYVSDKITVSAENGSVGSYKTGLSGDVKAEIYKKSGNSFYVRVAKSNVKVGSSINVKLSVDSTKTIDIAKKFDCGSNYQVLTPNTTTTTTLKSGTSISGTITLKGNKVNINKIDSKTKKTVSGAKLVVKNSKGKKIATFTTTDKAYTLKNLEAGTYTVSEISAPIGYELSEKTVSFTVKNDDKTVTVNFENEKLPNKVEISKQDVTSKKELKGAHLVVKDSSGKEVDSWVSTDEIHVIKNLEAGNYTLTETIAPEGYKLSTETVKFTVKGDGTTTKVVMYNTPKKNTIVNINKIDSKTKKNISGATIVIKDANNREVLKFISSSKAYTIDNLKPGTYTAQEIKAPIGYDLNEEKVSFTVKADDKTINLDILNTKTPTRVEISKQDVTSKKELKGAHLVVKDSNGKEVDSWVSTNEVHVIEGLEPGIYTLTETIAPEGYKLKTETIEFTVKDDGTTTKVVMYNELKKQTIVKINKIDSETKQPLAGATLLIKDAKGNDVKSFVTGNKSYILENLASGEYTVSEISAPDGYELSKEVMKFTVSNDDKEIEVNFLNTKKKIETKVEISKRDASTKEELKGAHLVVKDSSGKEVDSWVSTNEVHVIESLEPGIYTLTETVAPDGYILSEEIIEFTVKDDGTTTKVVMYNSKEAGPVPEVPSDPLKHQVEISKQDITTKEELPGATLVIKDESGNEIDRWVSSTTPHYIELKEGNYTLTEIQAPNGYDLSYEVVKFTVTDTTDIEKVIMYNSKTPNTADRSIGFIVSMMAFSLVGMLGAIFKIKKIFN